MPTVSVMMQHIQETALQAAYDALARFATYLPSPRFKSLRPLDPAYSDVLQPVYVSPL
jgi:hypothetical protein